MAYDRNTTAMTASRKHVSALRKDHPERTAVGRDAVKLSFTILAAALSLGASRASSHRSKTDNRSGYNGEALFSIVAPSVSVGLKESSSSSPPLLLLLISSRDFAECLSLDEVRASPRRRGIIKPLTSANNEARLIHARPRTRIMPKMSEIRVGSEFVRLISRASFRFDFSSKNMTAKRLRDGTRAIERRVHRKLANSAKETRKENEREIIHREQAEVKLMEITSVTGRPSAM